MVTTLTGKVTKELIEDWRKGYQKEAEYLRNKLEILLGILKQKGLFENSLVIITSDHGQLLGGENNRLGHGVFLDDELIRVPLWIKYPDALSEVSIDNTSEESAQYISLIRLYNTIIEAAIGDGASSLSDKIVFSETYGNPSPPIPSDKLSPPN
ncbi:sulfatase-like hydrolase/transferase [Thermococcus peptonophilus]|uniref:sulfatase-like hydrolase/transferase n=1 Tax=Thermococcus peptonophilus TaxID=53952 RepID=UPI003466B03F